MATGDHRHDQPFRALWIVLPLTALAVTALALRRRDVTVFGTLAMAWVLCAATLSLLGRLIKLGTPVPDRLDDVLRWRMRAR